MSSPDLTDSHQTITKELDDLSRTIPGQGPDKPVAERQSHSGHCITTGDTRKPPGEEGRNTGKRHGETRSRNISDVKFTARGPPEERQKQHLHPEHPAPTSPIGTKPSP
ncbi:uncharacterized protein LOC106938649 isoform X3 [Poecilia latipinna]|nr:PREDICTED: uncharacterized protein LOC106938649 isoform X3 [Poecilia latipinna]